MLEDVEVESLPDNVVDLAAFKVEKEAEKAKQKALEEAKRYRTFNPKGKSEKDRKIADALEKFGSFRDKKKENKDE